MKKAVLDTYAWIEYFRGTEEGEKVKSYIEDYRILTPSVVVAELHEKYVRTGLEEKWKARKHFLKMKSDILKLEFDVAEEAGDLKWDLRQKFDDVGLADAIILSHTSQEDATLLTGDDHLTFRKEVEDISS